jgi:Tfp pilus assembly protein PilZ
MKAGDSKDRRKDIRLTKKVPVVVIRDDTKGTYLESEDLSLGGVLLPLDESFPPGTEVMLHFYLPKRSQPIEVKGKVVNVQREIGVGIQFIDIEPEAKMAIWQFMLSKSK